jgi:hypothetical protein
MVKDPTTGRRVSRINSKDKWITVTAPALRIVDQDVFDTVQRRKQERGIGQPHRTRKPRHLLSGLLRCGACGAGMSVKDCNHGRVRIVCTQAKEAGTCSNKRPYYLGAIEATVLSGLKKELCNPKAIKRFLHSYNEEMKRLSATSSSSLHKLERQIDRANGEYSRLIDAVAKGIFSADDVRERATTLKRDKERLNEEKARIEQSSTQITLHPTAIDAYIDAVENLEHSIRGNSARARGTEECAQAIDRCGNRTPRGSFVGKSQRRSARPLKSDCGGQRVPGGFLSAGG